MQKKEDEFAKYLKKQLKDPEFKEEWEKLEPLYSTIEEKIKIRNKKKTKK